MKRVIVLAAALAFSGCGGGNGSAVTPPANPAAPHEVQITEIPVPGETAAPPQPYSMNGENVAVDAAGAVYFRSLAPQTLGDPVRYLNGTFTYTHLPAGTVTGLYGSATVSASGGPLIQVAGKRVLWDAWYLDGIPNDTNAIVYAGASGIAPEQAFPINISATASWGAPNGDLWVGGIDRGWQYSLDLDHAGANYPLSLPLNTSKPVALTGDGSGGAWLALDDGTVTHLNNALQTIASFHTQILAGGMIRAGDGSLWLTDQKNNAIVHMTTAGDVTSYPLPSANAEPAGIILAGDGTFWFTETQTNKIGRITTSGQITEYPLASAAYPVGIAVAGSASRTVWARTSDGLVRITL